MIMKFSIPLTSLSILFLFLCCNESHGQNDSDVRNLRQQLFVTNAYDTRIRPIIVQSQPTRIFVDFNLLALNEVNEVQETLRLTAYLRLKWTDAFLTWDPKDYGNLESYHWPQDDVWKPVIALRNSYLDYKPLGDETLSVENNNDGSMLWLPFQVFTSTCSMDVTYYPFDKQTCSLSFVAWGYSKKEINRYPTSRWGLCMMGWITNTKYTDKFASLQVAMAGGDQGINLGDYENNPQWELLDSSWEVITGLSDVTITFTMNIRREPSYVIFTVLLPVLLLTLLNIFVFILPCESGERVGYAVTVFLSFAVFFTLISAVLPEAVAIFTVYVIVMTAQSALICLIAIVQVRLSSRDENEDPVPKWLVFISIIGNGKCFRRSRNKRKVSSRGSTSVEVLKHSEKELAYEQTHCDTQDDVNDADPSTNDAEETWKHAITGLDNVLTVLFTLISVLVTAICIGVCATA